MIDECFRQNSQVLCPCICSKPRPTSSRIVCIECITKREWSQCSCITDGVTWSCSFSEVKDETCCLINFNPSKRSQWWCWWSCKWRVAVKPWHYQVPTPDRWCSQCRQDSAITVHFIAKVHCAKSSVTEAAYTGWPKQVSHYQIIKKFVKSC